MSAYYNEIDPDAVLILRALIDDGVIAPGEIDTRSITEVQPDDLRGFTQCHFFAGGGLWSVAARSAGWPDDRPIWTASCPCQPFSVAGKGAGADDERHLWPDLLRLVGAARPPVLLGEQVAGKAGYGWLDGVRADLAGEGYASRGVDIPACAVDAPHIRQRLYWVAQRDDVADANDVRREWRQGLADRSELDRADAGRAQSDRSAAGGDEGHRQALEHTPSIGRREGWAESGVRGRRPAAPGADASGVALGDALGSRLEGQCGHGDDAAGRAIDDRSVAAADGGDMGNAASDGWSEGERGAARARYRNQPPATYGRNGSAWADHDWIVCHDGKARRTQPSVPLLVDGLPGRVGLWRVAGNAISPVLAAEVIGALMDELDQPRMAA